MKLEDAVFRTSEMPVVRRVVCAAMQNKYGRLIIGPRHYDETMSKQIKYLREHDDDWSKSDITQGFIDQFGVFMDRREAWKVALAADQIRYRCGGDTTNGGTLYSENLY